MAIIFGQVRFVFNLALETKISAYNGSKKNLTAFDLINQMKELKDNECSWLKESPSQALQMSVRNLDNAYSHFFKGGGFPKYKNKHGKQSFQLPQGIYFSENNKEIFIPKLKFVGIDLHREFKGEIKTVTVSKTKTNKYFVSILVDNKNELPNKKPINESTTVGLDLGVKGFCITSDGKKFENKKFLKSTQNKLRIAQRSLQRKFQKGKKSDEQSNHYKRQRMTVALLHEKVRNQRQDYLHKTSKYLIENYDTICLEDLNVKGMSARCKPKKDEIGKHIANGQAAKSGLNKSVLDMGWAEFRTMLEYKAEWYGKNICVIGRFEPSSKLCSSCGAINKSLILSDREWVCDGCGKIHDRDENAAKNIKKIGLRNKPSASQREASVCASGIEAVCFS
jgi:putative transposase